MSEVPLLNVQWDDDTEDQFKTTWDFHGPDGPVDNLADLEALTGRPADQLAYDLVHLPFGKAAPAGLIREALDRVH